MKRSIYIGWDPREAAAYAVARSSLLRRLSQPIPVCGLVLEDLVARGLYTRPISRKPIGSRGILWDDISNAPMSTEHANARWLCKDLAGEGWVLFMDGDVLVLDDVAKLFDALDPRFAAYCVKHAYSPRPGLKMDGQPQPAYGRKNWSSVVALNASHPSNEKLTRDLINTAKGKDLHAFCWLADDEIGALPARWNYLIGEMDRPDDVGIAHFTLGTPDMPGYADCDFADEWRAERMRWAA